MSACSGFPAEEADREEEPGKPPGGYYQDVGPVERGAEEPGLHAGEEKDRAVWVCPKTGHLVNNLGRLAATGR